MLVRLVGNLCLTLWNIYVVYIINVFFCATLLINVIEHLIYIYIYFFFFAIHKSYCLIVSSNILPFWLDFVFTFLSLKKFFMCPMAVHCSILTWKIPLIEEAGGYSPQGYKESDMTEWLSKHKCQSVFWLFIHLMVFIKEYLNVMKSNFSVFEVVLLVLILLNIFKSKRKNSLQYFL